MDLRYTDEDEEFRAELRSWLARTLPQLPPMPAGNDWPARRAYDTTWQRLLSEAGYAGINWPKAYGGQEASPSEQLVFLEETAKAGAPAVGINFVGTLHAGPTLIVEGTEEQRSRHLHRILAGDEVWCQGFSEPEAGSDLASLRTTAVRDGDHYVVNGQKIWCSYAQVADYAELLVRTDPQASKHRGISWLILPMDTPGVEVRPLDTVLGSSEFAEVFLDDVRIPVADRVGEENDGWRITQVTFSFERGTAFVSELVEARRLVGELALLAGQIPRGAGRAGDDQGVQRDLALCAARLDALWNLTKRNVSRSSRTGDPGPGAMMIKLAYSETRKLLGDVAMKVLGSAGLAIDDTLVPGAGYHVEEHLRTLSLSIAAGTSQIQRNIIGERLLGLPKERQWTST